MQAIELGEKGIGPGHPCFIIAEAGVNHNGCLDRACALVDMAAVAGADAVKFQLYRIEEQVSGAAATAAYQQDQTGAENMKEMAASYDLPWEAHRDIAAHCRRRGILYCASSFEPAAVDLLVAMSAPFVKIASGEITNLPLLRSAARSGLPLLLSTGMSTIEDIDDAVAVLREEQAAALALFHCVSRYPTPPEAVNLRFMARLGERYGVPVGFSDHTLGTEAAVASVALGASMIEKHFTVDPSLPGPDHAMSLSPDGLKDFVTAVRKAEACLGKAEKVLSEEEMEVARAARRSLVSAQAIAAGEALDDGNVVLKRPGTGIDPRQWAELRGRRAAVDIPADSLITPEMLA